MACCFPHGATVDPKLNDLLAAASTVKPLAEAVIDNCNKTVAKGKQIVDFATNIKNALGGVDGNLSPRSYVDLQELHKDENMKSKVKAVGEMNESAIECATKAREMSTAMQEGADSSPDDVKEEVLNRSKPSDTENDEEAELSEYEKDIAELEESVESLENTNVLTAVSDGSNAFDKFEEKLASAQKLYDRTKELSISIATIAQKFEVDTCCGNAKTVVATIEEMKECLRLVKLVSSLAESGQKLSEILSKFINLSWDKLENSTEEFVAAKKMKNFVNGLSPTKSKDMSEDGTTAESTVVSNEVVDSNLMCCSFPNFGGS